MKLHKDNPYLRFHREFKIHDFYELNLVRFIKFVIRGLRVTLKFLRTYSNT